MKPNQASNMDTFDSDEEKHKLKGTFEHENRIPCFDSDDIDFCSENASNDAESLENPIYYYDTKEISEKVSKKRQVGEGKSYKKPGRKPITSEPSTVRSYVNYCAIGLPQLILLETQSSKPCSSTRI